MVGGKLKKLASITIVLLLIATAVSSIESFSIDSYTKKNTETKALKPLSTHDVFNTVKISECDFLANQTQCGLLRLSAKSDEMSKNYANAISVVKLMETSVSGYSKSKISLTSNSKPSESVSDYKSAQILPASSSSKAFNLSLLGSTSTVTCSFHAGGGCNPEDLPSSCTPSCDGTLSGCDCEIDDYYCYEVGSCFSESGCDSGGRDYTKTCNCEVGSCPTDYPHCCGGSCWSDCTNPDYPHWNCKSDGTVGCCHKDYAYYCEKLQSCCVSQEFCDRYEYCGGSSYICVDPANHPTCYSGQFYCCAYTNPFYCPTSIHYDCWHTRENPCAGFAVLTGVVQDGDKNPIQGAIVKWTYCNDTLVISDTTDINGAFYLKAPAGSYKLKVTSNSITYPFIVNGTECYYYAPDAYSYLLTIATRTTLHGYIKDLDNNPLEVTVELHDCSSDTLIASDDTDSTGYFSVTADAGHYKIHIAITEAYRIKLVDSEGNDCFLLVGDVDIGTLNINPTPDCSVFNYMCYGPDKNIKLFNCYWDDGCLCYGQECRCGCTDGAPECDPCDVGTIYVDVDNINENYNPLPGARVYLEGEYKGTTDSFGKKTVSAGYGYREVKVECPDSSDCDTKTRYVDGDEYLYFDCDCDTHRGDLHVNVDNVNGYPVANVYVYVDSEEGALTNPFGYAYIEDVPHGVHHIDIRYRITNPDYEGDYQKSLDVTVDETKEVVNFIATLPGESHQAQSKGDCSNFSRIDNFTPEIAPLAVAVAVIDIASVAWSTDEFCKCVFQEEGSFGVPQCINAIKGCVGDTRNCIAELRENAGPTADRCKFEEAMLVGDAASPFIPAGIAGHGLAMVVGKSRVLRLVDDIGEAGRVIGKKGEDLVSYVKEGLERFAMWFDDLGKFKKFIVEGTEHWSDDALEGLERIAIAGGGGPKGKDIAKKFVDQLGDEYAQKIAKGVKELQKRRIAGADELADEIGKAAEKENWEQLKGAIFEAEVAADSNYIDNVAALRRDIPHGEIDILLKNGDIIECKNIKWVSPRSDSSKIKKIVKQVGTFRKYDSNVNIKVIFKELPTTVRSDIESRLTATHGNDVMNYVTLEVF